MDKWSEEKEGGLQWVNDQQTLVIEVPMKKVDLNFTQQIWFFRPDLFEHMEWGVHGFVRVWWNTIESAHHKIMAVMD